LVAARLRLIVWTFVSAQDRLGEEFHGGMGILVRSALEGIATGGLVDTTVGATVNIADTGFKCDCVAAVSGRLLPGYATFVSEVEEYSTRPVDDAVWRNGGVIFRHPSIYFDV
jgi:hypothetical protein